MSKQKRTTTYKFIDEAGDLTSINVGSEGVSKTFIMGMAEIDQSLSYTRQEIRDLEKSVEIDPFYKEVPSVQKRIAKFGKFFFHAKDDRQEIRKLFFDYLRNKLNFSYEALFIPKIDRIINIKYDGGRKENRIYADLLSKLLKNKLNYEKVHLLISQRQNTTTRNTFEEALKNIGTSSTADKFTFTVKNPSADPILSVVDYCNWAIQRVLEKGEAQYLNYLWDAKKISLILDVFQVTAEYPHNYYKRENRLRKMVEIK